jgi:hypothetical protein
MRVRRRNTFGRPLGHRLVAGLTLAAYLAAAVGFPLPARARIKAGQPFPCQNNPCGCQSAEQCWRSCCCYTVEERWAWARANHVEPPAYAAKPSGDGWRTVRLRDHACCAAHHSGCACCAGGKGAPTCCHKKPKAAPDLSRTGVRMVLGLTSQKCQGSANLWVSTGAVLPVAPPLACQPFLTPQGWLASANVHRVDALAPPPDPPPRSFAA